MDASKEKRTAVLTKDDRVRGVVRAALLALLLAVCLGALLLFGAAALLSAIPTGTAHTEAIGCALGALTALLGGILAGRFHKHAGALSGLLFGVLYLLLMLLLSRFAGTAATPLRRTMGYGLFVVLALLGGTLGGMKRGGKHRRRHR